MLPTPHHVYVPHAAGASAAAAPARHVLSILDLSSGEVEELCARALELERDVRPAHTLRGCTVGVYFRKTSTRTRTAFMVGAARLGAHLVTFGPDDLQINTGETPADTARVLAGYLDVLVMRTNEGVDEMRAFARQPGLAVVNALSAEEHPTQALADLSALRGHFGCLEGLDILYCGEGNKTAAALALAMSRIRGTRLRIATPAGYGVAPATLARAQSLAERHGAIVEQIHDLASATGAVDVVYTSRWQEMGVAKADPQWRARFLPFRVTSELMERVARARTVFMHDLPAVRGEDVEDDVLDGPRSLAWVQAQHKLFSAMALLEWCGRRAAGGLR